MFGKLMGSRRFAPLFWCQFCSALNDNFLKNALAMLILFGLGGRGGVEGGHAGVLITASGVIFIAPFFILSGLGGQLADRFDKARVAQRVKLAEIPIAALAAAGFYLHSVLLLMVTLALFGVMAALFGPVKYGILPEKLTMAELSSGNALIEGATFLAILMGTITGGIAVAEAKSGTLIVATIVTLAVASWLLARAIPAHRPAAPDLPINRNPWSSTVALLHELRTGDRRLWGGAHIVSWFWLVGFVALSLLPALVKQGLGGSEGVVTLCLATFTVGIAVGSALAARASHGRPNLVLVPIGAVLMGAAAVAIAVVAAGAAPFEPAIRPGAFTVTPIGAALLLALFGLAVAGGLYVVPAFAAVQAWSPVERRARVIASVNVLNAAYMVGGGAVVAGRQAAGVGLPVLFGALGLLTPAAAVLAVRAWRADMPSGLSRFVPHFSATRTSGRRARRSTS
jgi:acyl-[acyl-carrier-protein]-phospholipid O-acyltransferase/long-chain-fatty-acid--[acyl-carrier-protein] ligase